MIDSAITINSKTINKDCERLFTEGEHGHVECTMTELQLEIDSELYPSLVRILDNADKHKQVAIGEELLGRYILKQGYTKNPVKHSNLIKTLVYCYDINGNRCCDLSDRRIYVIRGYAI